MVWMLFSRLLPTWTTDEEAADVFLVALWVMVVALDDTEEEEGEEEDPLMVWLPILLVLQVEELMVTVVVAVVLQAVVVPEVGHGLGLFCLMALVLELPVAAWHLEEVEEEEQEKVDSGAAEEVVVDELLFPVHREELLW